jgi:hypothetical protein
LTGGGTAGAADANSVQQQLLNTQSRGDWSWREANLRGLERSWYVAWSWGRRYDTTTIARVDLAWE